MALQRDSRTLKFAASVARMGHESVVVEGEPSNLLKGDLPFRLISPQQSEDARGEDDVGAVPAKPPLIARVAERSPSWLRRLGRPVARRIVMPVLNWLHVVRLNARDYLGRNRQAWRLLPDADVYWLHSFWQFPSVYLKARRRRARFLYDTPDAYWEEDFGVEGPSAAVLRAYEAIEGFCIRRAERFTTVSEGVAGLLEQRFGRRPELLRNFHDLRLDAPSEGDVRAAAGAGQDDFLLVVVGNMKPELLVEQALLAMRELPDEVHLAFVGRNHEPNRAMVEELELSGRVHLLGHQAPTHLVSFIRTADASPILTRATTDNDRYALPNKFFHAVAAGLPLLFPPLPEMSALAKQHDLGVEIDPADPASIASGVRSLSEDPEATARYRANVEAARGTMSWEREEPSLAEILGR